MFQFTIREAMLIMLVCCLAGAWWSDHRLMVKTNARTAIERDKCRLIASYLIDERCPLHMQMCNAGYICAGPQN